jgi:predicted N-acetyltransferase YhbS
VPLQCVPFAPEHLDAVLALCVAEGWPSMPEDPARAERALTAPGVSTVVAVDAGEVVGFATMLSDGEIQAYLSLLVVAAVRRGQGIGARLVQDAFRDAGGTRVDVLAAEGSEAFYAAMTHRRLAGFRVYPDT